MHPKSFYYSYHANNDLFEIDHKLINQVINELPTSVLDFGTGTGKNIKEIINANKSITVCGLDLSFLNIIHARAKNNIPFLIIGDEYMLARLTNFDVIMTCSVLCHIQDIKAIIKDFKRITNKSIIIAETNDNGGEFYYPHDYESFGFVDTKSGWHSPANNCYYTIYKYTK
jgi:ubiquinone/menaquinone biosynthesis C-methylase UbiE